MSRVDTVSWQDGVVLTKLMGELQRELMDWQVCAYDVVTARKASGRMGGDRGVLVGAIRLRDRLNEVIEASAAAQRNAGVEDRGDKCTCPVEGREEQVIGYDPVWRDGQVVCVGCGKFVRDYDAG